MALCCAGLKDTGASANKMGMIAKSSRKGRQEQKQSAFFVGQLKVC